MRQIPRIGLTPYFDRETGHTWMRKTYVESIFRAGGMPCILPLPENQEQFDIICGSMDGYLIVGGDDVDPARYGQEKSPLCEELCPERDQFELALVKELIRLDKPVGGICRGCQILNVALGGTLIQDIPSMKQTSYIHNQEPPYERPVHPVEIASGSLLHQCLGQDRLHVNSWHHQAVDQLADGLVSSAAAPDGIIEAVEMPGKRFVLALQWHPEYLWGTPSENFFRLLVERAGNV